MWCSLVRTMYSFNNTTRSKDNVRRLFVGWLCMKDFRKPSLLYSLLIFYEFENFEGTKVMLESEGFVTDVMFERFFP